MFLASPAAMEPHMPPLRLLAMATSTEGISECTAAFLWGMGGVVPEWEVLNGFGVKVEAKVDETTAPFPARCSDTVEGSGCQRRASRCTTWSLPGSKRRTGDLEGDAGWEGAGQRFASLALNPRRSRTGWTGKSSEGNPLGTSPMTSRVGIGKQDSLRLVGRGLSRIVGREGGRCRR
jgi:hypothetical protein